MLSYYSVAHNLGTKVQKKNDICKKIGKYSMEKLDFKSKLEYLTILE